MVSNQINRMAKFDASHRSEYEAALKYTSATAIVGKILLIQTDKGRISLIVCTAGADTVCGRSLKHEFITYGT